MGKTTDQLYKDVQSAIKLFLTEMERLAALPPPEACEPYSYDETRRKIVRKVWQLYKDHEASLPPATEGCTCDTCGQLRARR